VTATYGPLLRSSLTRGERPYAVPISPRSAVRPRYVLCVLRPSRDLDVDAGDFAHSLAERSAGRPLRCLPEASTATIAGRIGERATLRWAGHVADFAATSTSAALTSRSAWSPGLVCQNDPCHGFGTLSPRGNTAHRGARRQLRRVRSRRGQPIRTAYARITLRAATAFPGGRTRMRRSA